MNTFEWFKLFFRAHINKGTALHQLRPSQKLVFTFWTQFNVQQKQLILYNIFEYTWIFLHFRLKTRSIFFYIRKYTGTNLFTIQVVREVSCFCWTLNCVQKVNKSLCDGLSWCSAVESKNISIFVFLERVGSMNTFILTQWSRKLSLYFKMEDYCVIF